MVEDGKESLVAAIHDIEEQDAVSVRGLLRFNNEQVGGKLHLALAVPRRLVEIGDDAIARIIRRDREVDLAGELFIWSDRAEGFSAEHVLTARDFDARDLGLYRGRYEP